MVRALILTHPTGICLFLTFDFRFFEIYSATRKGTGNREQGTVRSERV